MFRKRHPQIGAAPGTLIFRSESVPAKVQIVRYSSNNIETIPVAGLDDIEAPVAAGELLWIDVAGIDDPEVLKAGGKRFGLSDLAMENIVNVPQRPKTELLDDKLLSIAHVLRIGPEDALHIDQLSLVLGPNFVITVHSQASEFLDPVRQRMQFADSRLRQRGSDYLAYTVIDTVVDGYYPVLESLGERLEHLEDEALENPRPDVLKGIHRLRSQLIQVRRSSWPMREALESLLRADTPLVRDTTESFLRDTHSHCAQIVDVVEMYRESAGALVSTYMSSVAHRSNEIMKVLAMVSSIFVPMTFVAGIYGMNFEHMPELSHPWSYPVALSAMMACATVMIIFFFRRGWFGPISLRVGASTRRTTIGVHRPGEMRTGLRSVMANVSSRDDASPEGARPIKSEAA